MSGEIRKIIPKLSLLPPLICSTAAECSQIFTFIGILFHFPVEAVFTTCLNLVPTSGNSARVGGLNSTLAYFQNILPFP